MKKANSETLITLETLEKMPSGERACLPARQWFAASFPNGATIREVWDACPDDTSWKIWFALNFYPDWKLHEKFLAERINQMADSLCQPRLGEPDTKHWNAIWHPDYYDAIHAFTRRPALVAMWWIVEDARQVADFVGSWIYERDAQEAYARQVLLSGGKDD